MPVVVAAFDVDGGYTLGQVLVRQSTCLRNVLSECGTAQQLTMTNLWIHRWWSTTRPEALRITGVCHLDFGEQVVPTCRAKAESHFYQIQGSIASVRNASNPTRTPLNEPHKTKVPNKILQRLRNTGENQRVWKQEVPPLL